VDNIIEVPGFNDIISQKTGTPIGGLISQATAEIYCFTREIISAIHVTGQNSTFSPHRTVLKYINTTGPKWVKQLFLNVHKVSPVRSPTPPEILSMCRYRDNVITTTKDNTKQFWLNLKAYLEDLYCVTFTLENCGSTINCLGLSLQQKHDTIIFAPTRKPLPQNRYNRGASKPEQMIAYAVFVSELGPTSIV